MNQKNKWLRYLLTALFTGWFAYGCYRIPDTRLATELLTQIAAHTPLSAEQAFSLGAIGFAAAGGVVSVWLFPKCLDAVVGFAKAVNRKRLWKSLFSHSPGEGVKTLLRFGLNLLLAVLGGTALLLAVFALPSDEAVEEHMHASAEILEREGMHPNLYPWCLSRLDNYTDAIMLMNAADDTDESTVRRAMLVYRGKYDKDREPDPCQDFVDHYGRGESFDGKESYSRYWHGYLLFLKPLLRWMDYAQIRTLNGILQTAVLLWLLWLLRKRGLGRYILPMVLSVGMLMPVALARSLQFSDCYYLLMLGSIALLRHFPGKDPKRVLGTVFLNLGISVAYFDFLTYPLATYALPMAVALLLMDDASTEEKLCAVIRCGIAWGLGYAGMWSGKWVMAALTTGDSTFASAAEAIALRLSDVDVDGVTQCTVVGTIFSNFAIFCFTPVLAAVCFVFIRRLPGKMKKQDGMGQILPFVLLALLPFLWYAVLKNHSAIHFCFTNKALMASVFSALAAVTSLQKKQSV